MRIVIDMQGAQTASRFRGIGRYTLSFVKAVALNRGEHEIILALSGLLPETIEPIRTAFDGLLLQENIRVWYAPGPVKQSALKNDFRRQEAELIREAFLASLQPDVIHITSIFEGYEDEAVTSIGQFDRHTAVSVALYDLIPLINPRQYLEPNPLYEAYYLRKVEHLKKAACCLAISEFSRQEGLAHLPQSRKEIINISTAIDDQFKQSNIDPKFIDDEIIGFDIGKRFILYAGGDDERKNLPRLVQAYAQLSKDLRENYQLVFAGRMSESAIDFLKTLADQVGISPRQLVFMGYVTDECLIQLYSHCYLFVFPSWHEGFGLPALEAMACGAPVIGSNATSTAEVIGLDEALFDPLDVKSISQKISDVLNDEYLRERLRDHGLAQSRKFSWDATALHALKAWEDLSSKRKNTVTNEVFMANKRPRLAFFSPMPPERTGIAYYSTELLPALASYYQINVVVDEFFSGDFVENDSYCIRDVTWFREHVGEIDWVIYQMGNSPFHRYMLPLLIEFPGTVVLHDFYLSGLKSWMELDAGIVNYWTRSLYNSHGYQAVKSRYLDIEKTKQDYPVNLDILQYAKGVIVHSNYSRQLIYQWYGDNFLPDISVLPLSRKPAILSDKEASKASLGFNQNDFIVCSFGFIDPTKLNHLLLDGWLQSSLAKEKNCYLIFVGENHGGHYGANLKKIVKLNKAGRQIKITGFVEPKIFHQYLIAADLAVQLRSLSRGETSGAILDCMSHGLPVITNANGPIAELDSKSVLMLPEVFEDAELTTALEQLWINPDERNKVGSIARQKILEHHNPDYCAKQYENAIEYFRTKDHVSVSSLIQASADLMYRNQANNSELLPIAQAIAQNFPLVLSGKKLYLDVTATFHNDLKTGIERVARSLVVELLKAPPVGFQIEPVYLDKTNGVWCHRSAARYTLELMDCESSPLENGEVITPYNGDILVTLDLSGGLLVEAQKSGLFNGYRNNGISVYAVVFDLLPISMPEKFPPGSGPFHLQWLKSISTFDGAMCISKTVANNLIQSQEDEVINFENRRPFKVGWFDLGSDINNEAQSVGIPDDASKTLVYLKSKFSFLMVGTIEPRKGYLEVIHTFSHLWNDGIDANLVIVGKEGWRGLSDDLRRDIPKTIETIRSHSEFNKRLFWIDGVSDEYLDKIYNSCSCLIAASYDEGFGLPIIEAAQHGLLIIARDIPIFREVSGSLPSYFQNEGQQNLSTVIQGVMLKNPININQIKNLKLKSWKDSAKSLVANMINGDRTYQMVTKEYRQRAKEQHLNLIHEARISMVRSMLPQGDIILDLGGANCPLYKMQYPHHFKRLYVIDLPPEQRCDMYKEVVIDSNCDGGEIVVKYGDMTDLSCFDDESVDFVWSGQSIEHVSERAGASMCRAAFRVLKKGGVFCLDTPNRRLTAIHVKNAGINFIHPEHCVEYQPEQLKILLEQSGFIVQASFGICEMPNTLVSGEFCYEDFLLGLQITEDVSRGYIQFFRCLKP